MRMQFTINCTFILSAEDYHEIRQRLLDGSLKSKEAKYIKDVYGYDLSVCFQIVSQISDSLTPSLGSIVREALRKEHEKE